MLPELVECAMVASAADVANLDAAFAVFGLAHLPIDAQIVSWAFERGGADPALWVRIEVGQDDVDELLSGWGFSAPLGMERRVGDYTGTGFPWWRPDSALLTGSGRVELMTPRRHARHVLVGSEGASRRVVYAFVVGL